VGVRAVEESVVEGREADAARLELPLRPFVAVSGRS
jgi:hypothetical protein